MKLLSRCLLFLISFAAFGFSAHSSDDVVQILMINSLNQEMPWQSSVEKGLLQALDEQSIPFDLYVENLDVGRFDESEQVQAMASLIAAKYRNKPIDIIVTQDVTAAGLLTRLAPLFAKLPKIYLEPGANFTPEGMELSVTIEAELDFEEATKAAVKLIKPSRVIALVDTTSGIGRDLHQRFQSLQNSNPLRVPVDLWLNLSVEQLLQRVKALSPDVLLLYTPLFHQYQGVPLTPYQLAEMLSEHAQAPMLTYWHSLLGSGVFGGYLLSGELLGRQTASTIAHYLRFGEMKSPDAQQLSAHYYDWRQMQKFKIKKSQLPNGANVVYEQPSYLEKHGMVILISVIIILMLLSFLAFAVKLNNKRLMLLRELNRERASLERRVTKRTQQLNAAKEQAEHLAAVKSEFLANMSHEIRTPINGVMGLAKMLEHSPLNDEQQVYLEKINYSCEQLLHVINEILDFSRIESGQVEIEEAPFSLSKVVAYIDLTFSLQAAEKGIAFCIDVADDVPGELIGDIARINQVLLNLCANAVKFTENGKVCLTICAEPMGEQEQTGDFQRKLYFTVEDTGIGIDDQYLNNLFDAFTQEDSSTTRKFGGTGLGLSISKRLCQLMDGDIEVSSRQGKGSRFTASMTLGVRNAERPCGENVLATSEDLPPLEGLKILVAEDNQINQLVVVAMLEQDGATVEVADNGLLCTEKLKQQDFNLILMDIHMPVMDGIEATQVIRAMENKAKASIPIVALTANVLEDDVKHYLSVGMNAHVAKPTKIDTLRRTIAAVSKPVGEGQA